MEKLIILALAASCVSLTGAQELLTNADFEAPFTNDDWTCTGQGTVERSTDAYAGNYSGKVSGRTQVWNSLAQWFSMEPNSQYRFRAYVKLLTLLDGYFWHEVQMLFKLELSDGTTQNEQFALLPYTRTDWGWEEIGGDFIMDGRNVTRAQLEVKFGESKDIEFLMDEATVTKVVEDADWKTKADARIEQIRKGNITVNIDIRGNCDPSKVSVKLKHFRHEFPFGSAVRALVISPGNEESDEKYQQTFFDNFNWGVTANSLKWKAMEKQRGVVEYERTDNALDAFDAGNVPARGHSLIWGKEQNNPDWLHSGFEGDNMTAEIARRINYTVTHYTGRFRHYDVNNEWCHGDWYEEKTGDYNITNWMFEEANRLDPDTHLFLNDFAVVRGGSRTICYTNVAKRMKAAGIPLRGLGLQSHIKSYPDIALFQDRLDTIKSAGIPIWITEMDYADTNVTRRADGIEDALRLYFSQPEIEGIVLWHFGNESTGNGEPHKTLFDGPDYTPNAAGLRWQHLMKTEWKTWKSLDPSSANEDFSFRGFYGNYTVKVKYDDVVKEKNYFFVAKGQTNHLDVVVDNC